MAHKTFLTFPATLLVFIVVCRRVVQYLVIDGFLFLEIQKVYCDSDSGKEQWRNEQYENRRFQSNFHPSSQKSPPIFTLCEPARHHKTTTFKSYHKVAILYFILFAIVAKMRRSVLAPFARSKIFVMIMQQTPVKNARISSFIMFIPPM